MTATSLVDGVYGAIAQHSKHQANRFRKLFESTCSHVIDAHGEKVALNHFWRLELGGLKRNTISERECLTTEVTDKEWLNNFCLYILIVVIEENLPSREQ